MTTHMKLFGKLAPIAAIAAVAAVPYVAEGGIANTKHNLGSSGTGPNHTTGTGEICVFCHTPHGSDTGAAVPLWNRNISSPPTYTTYDQLGTSTIDAAFNATKVGGVSLACLSCHDGTQAFDSLLNDPGSGATNTSFSGGTWTGASQMNSTTNSMANLGTDLRNDHPIGIQFAGAGPVGATASDPDFATAVKVTKNSVDLWYVDMDSDGKREATDIILYNRDSMEGMVECASCHDPHVEAKGAAGEQVSFLRVSQAGSGLCLACHTK